MARTQLILPENFSFVTQIPVRITDINYGGHVGNNALLGILHEVRLQFLTHQGCSEIDFFGSGLIMKEVMVNFSAEAFYGDTLIASVAATDAARINFNIYYKLEKKVNEKIVTVATAKTQMVCYDYEKKKVCSIPEAAMKQIFLSKSS